MPSDLAPHPLTRLLDTLHDDLLSDDRGTNKQSIPALADAEDAFGVALVTTTGQVYRVGEAERRFSLQSAVKPFVYALAMADSGVDVVREAVGVEPTGEAFDAILLETGTGRPRNPMVNAGAILTACLVSGTSVVERTERIRSGLSGFAGRELQVDEDVYEQEAVAADRNRALAYLMTSDGTLPLPVDEAIEVYLRACSLEVTAVDLAVMGATLAAGGVNPLTGVQVVPVEVVTTTLTVMATCGMYDGSGSWFVRVGLPAKSGVGGGVVASKPGQLGIGTYSPPLDDNGNSFRGMLACERLADELGLHEFAPDGTGVAVVRRSREGEEVLSSAAHDGDDGNGDDGNGGDGNGEDDSDAALLRANAERIRVTELQGPLSVSAAETLCRLLLESEADRPRPCWLVLDMHDLGHFDEAALELARQTFTDLTDHGVHVLLVDRDRPTAAPWSGQVGDEALPDVDTAVRRCEQGLLAHLRYASEV